VHLTNLSWLPNAAVTPVKGITISRNVARKQIPFEGKGRYGAFRRRIPLILVLLLSNAHEHVYGTEDFHAAATLEKRMHKNQKASRRQ